MRLRQRLRDAGLPSADEAARPVGAWAAGVSMEEFQQVHRKWTAAEDRVRELEQYIKDQSARQRAGAEEELRNLRQALLQGSLESRQLRTELEALRLHHQQKVCF